MAKDHLLANIRTLLWEGFTVEELRRFCYDTPDFRAVYDPLAPETGKAGLIDHLIVHSEQKFLFEPLLVWAKQGNPDRYWEHHPYYREPVNQPFDKYRLISLLGRGGMADVYKAYDPALYSYVAIKMLHSHLADNEEFIERFLHEAAAVAQLRHSNIVRVHNFGLIEAKYCMVMEFIKGPSLETELQWRKATGQLFSLAKTVEIFSGLAAAVDYAHTKGIVHRDLKPSNIMFTADGQVVLTDFGIARTLDVNSYTATGVVIGTPAYMSPEQADGKSADQRSDIYSMGVILYEIVTGHPPFEAASPLALMLKHTTEAPSPPTKVNPDVPEAVGQVILKSLNKKPADRYQTADDMVKALVTAINPPDDMSLEFSYDVFVSYTQVDRTWVLTELLPRLDGAGLRVCLDLRDFETGSPLVEAIVQAILTSRKTLLVLTPAYLADQWAEYGQTLLHTLDPDSRQRRLIPLHKEPCELPLHLKSLVSVDFVNPITPDLPWTQLLRALRVLPHRRLSWLSFLPNFSNKN